MTYTHVGRILFLLLVVATLPVHASAQAPIPVGEIKDVCSITLDGIFSAAKSIHSSASVIPGDVVDIPLVVKNKTQTPLADIHLLVKVTRLGNPADVVLLQYYPDSLALPPGESATTTVSWITSPTEASGLYRVDIYTLPSAHFVSPQITSDVPATANLLVQVMGGNKASPVVFAKDRIMIDNRIRYNPKYPILFDEGEQGVISFPVHNNAKHSVSAVLNWNLYIDTGVGVGKSAFSTSTELKIPGSGTMTVEFPLPIVPSTRYVAVAEIIENGQHVLMPFVFYRTTNGPIPVNVFGIEPEKGGSTPFELRSGETYTIFACPAGASARSSTTVSMIIENADGKKVFEESVVKNPNDQGSVIKYLFVPQSDIPNAKITLTMLSGKERAQQVLNITCVNSKDATCATQEQPTPGPENTKRTSSSRVVTVTLVLLLAAGLIAILKRKHN